MPPVRLSAVEGILAVLDEGHKTGTNKMGLLLALIDLAPTLKLGSETLPIDDLAEKLIELHWEHARTFEGTVLRQVASPNRANTRIS